MLSERHRISHHGCTPPITLTVLGAALLVVMLSCGGGVSEEEFNAVMKDLETEKTHSQALESDLAIERADATRLVEAVDRFEARVAELESGLAKERAAIIRVQEKIDEAEVEAGLLAAFLAWNRKDQEEFAARFTDSAISETLLSVPTSLGELPIALRRVMDTAVADDTATIHAMFALGTQRHSVRYSMVKQDGVWKIGGEERLSPKVHGDTPVVDIKVDGCAQASDSEIFIGQTVAFKVENVRQEETHLILKMVAEDVDPGLLLHSSMASPEGVSEVAFVREAKSGVIINIAFTEPLEPGRYVLLCFSRDPGVINGVPPTAEGIVATFMVE